MRLSTCDQELWPDNYKPDIMWRNVTDWVLSGLVSKYHVFGVFLLDLYQQIPVLSISVFSSKISCFLYMFCSGVKIYFSFKHADT